MRVLIHITDFHLYASENASDGGTWGGLRPFHCLRKVLEAAACRVRTLPLCVKQRPKAPSLATCWPRSQARSPTPLRRAGQEPRPAAVLLSGDFSQDDSASSYQLGAQLVKSSFPACPLLFVPGNHDQARATAHAPAARRAPPHPLRRRRGSFVAGRVTAHPPQNLAALAEAFRPEDGFLGPTPLAGGVAQATTSTESKSTLRPPTAESARSGPRARHSAAAHRATDVQPPSPPRRRTRKNPCTGGAGADLARRAAVHLGAGKVALTDPGSRGATSSGRAEPCCARPLRARCTAS